MSPTVYVVVSTRSAPGKVRVREVDQVKRTKVHNNQPTYRTSVLQTDTFVGHAKRKKQKAKSIDGLTGNLGNQVLLFDQLLVPVLVLTAPLSHDGI